MLIWEEQEHEEMRRWRSINPSQVAITMSLGSLQHVINSSKQCHLPHNILSGAGPPNNGPRLMFEYQHTLYQYKYQQR